MYQRDIAKKLGVSQTTVSLVLNNPQTKRISVNKRDKILNFLKEKNYFMQSAREKTGCVRLLLPPYDSHYHSFGDRFIRGIQSAASDANYTIVVSECQEDLILPSAKIDGVIVQNWIAREKLDKFAKSVPTVLLNHPAEKAEFDMVCPDNYGGINLAIEHLLDNGHSRIAYFGIQPHRSDIDPNYLERLNGFYNSCRNHGIKIRDEFVQLPKMQGSKIIATEEVINQTLKNWSGLPESPTAVICCNDGYALMMIRQANKLEIKIPAQLSIVGTDNIQAGKLSWPALTSIDHNGEEMGRLGFEMLLKRIKNPQRPPSRVSCISRLELRESVAKFTGQ